MTIGTRGPAVALQLAASAENAGHRGPARGARGVCLSVGVITSVRSSLGSVHGYDEEKLE